MRVSPVLDFAKPIVALLGMGVVTGSFLDELPKDEISSELHSFEYKEPSGLYKQRSLLLYKEYGKIAQESRDTNLIPNQNYSHIYTSALVHAILAEAGESSEKDFQRTKVRFETVAKDINRKIKEISSRLVLSEYQKSFLFDLAIVDKSPYGNRAYQALENATKLCREIEGNPNLKEDLLQRASEEIYDLLEVNSLSDQSLTRLHSF